MNDIINLEFFKPYFLLLIILVILIVIDFTTGVSKAFLNKNFSSKKLRKGIDKYRSYFTLSIISIVIDVIITFYTQDSCNLIAVSSIIFMITCEITSIIENCGNIKIPPILTQTVDLLKDIWSKDNRKK